MRFFLNVIYDFEKSPNAFGAAFAGAQKVLWENNWHQERILFHFKDINDAAEEKNTVHSKLIRSFPQMAPYWNSDYEHYLARNVRPSAVCGNPPAGVSIKPHQYSHFTNFPGWKDGRVTYLPGDDEITGELLKAVCEKIPSPYSFYEAVIVLDGVDWYGDCDLFPAIAWSVVKEEQEAGKCPDEPTIDETFSEYQSNSVRLAKRFDVGTELDIQIELTDKRGMDAALKIIEIFAEQFGTPTKQYVRARESRQECSAWRKKREEMQRFFDRWTGKTKETLTHLYYEKRENITAKTKSVSRKTMRKHFLEKNAFCRHELRRWDDYGWCRVLPQHYCYYLELMINENTQGNRKYVVGDANMNIPTCVDINYPMENRFTPVNEMSLHCYGCNFDLVCNVQVGDFLTDEGDRAGEIAFLLFEEFLRRFEEEAVPQLVKIYGGTPEKFVQTSYSRDYIYNQRCIAGLVMIL